MEKHGNIRVNLEIQVLDEENWNERGVYYLAENLLDLKKGEDYKNLKTTVQIGILDFDLWKSGKNPFYQVYELWDTEHDRVFTNKMKLCVLSLRQAEKAEERERQSGLYDWVKALTAETWEELQELSEKYGAAMLICSLKGLKVEQEMDLKSVLTIASFLFFAEVVSETGILSMVAAYLQSNIANPKLLVMAIMLITSVVAGIFSAGPAAAMMPIIIQLCNGPLSAQADWIAVAYAAAICAGSSLFMWSATAGFILSGKVKGACITDAEESKTSWGVAQYMKYGFINYAIQISIALLVMAIIL